MACKSNTPTFKYVTVENLVITYNQTPYPIKNMYTNKKYIIWNIDRPYQLEDSNVRPEESLLEYLIVINDNGLPTIINHDNLVLSFDSKTNGSNGSGGSGGDYESLKDKVDANTTKYNMLIKDVDGITNIIGKTEELEDGNIIYNLNKIKADSESFGVKLSEIQTQVDDKYKELKPILTNDLIEYLKSVSEYKLSFTNLKTDESVTNEELELINTNKTNLNNGLTALLTSLDSLKSILDEVGDTTKSQLIEDAKTQLTSLNNGLISTCDMSLANNKLDDYEKTTITQKAYELSQYIGVVQNTCNNITLNGLGGVVYSVKNDFLIYKDKTENNITELTRSDEVLSENYTSVKQTTDKIVEEVGGLKMTVGDLTEGSKKDVRSVETYYCLSSSQTELVGTDFGNIKKGDLIFQGNKDNGRYKGIYHVGIYYGLDDNGVPRILECTGNNIVKLHSDSKTMGMVLASWDSRKKSDIVCLARPHSTSSNRVFAKADEFVSFAKTYYDKRDKYITYGNINIMSDNSTRAWSEVTTKGADSPDGLYRHIDCSTFLNLAMRGIPFDEVLASESVYNARNLSARSTYAWTKELPRYASEQCEEVENLGWAMQPTEWHTNNQQWTTELPKNPNNYYIWSKNVTTFKDGSQVDSEVNCISNDYAQDGKSIQNIVPYYYESTSGTELIGGIWSTMSPMWTADKYVWRRDLISYDDDSTMWTEPICVSGTSPMALELQSSTYVVAFDSFNVPKSTESITLTAKQTNFDDDINWFTNPNTVTLNGTGNTRTISPSAFTNLDRVIITVQSRNLNTNVVIVKVKDGSNGEDGTSVKILGEYSTEEELNAAHPSGNENGDGYIVNGDLYVWNGTSFVNVGKIKGEDGTDGKTTYVHIKYSNDGKTFTSNNGETPGSWIGILTDFNVNDSGTFSDYTWKRIEGQQGLQGIQGEKGDQGIPGTSATTYYTWIKYADDSSGNGLSDSPTNKKYIGFAYNKTTATESTNKGDYTWSLIQGEKGDTGVAGTNGTDGTTYYTWIKYSDNANGNPCYDTPTSTTKYIGIAVNKTTATESGDYTQYAWSKFQGDQGIAGTNGADGKTSYFHIKYSSVANPTSSSQMTETPSTYIGTYVDYTAADSTDPTKYTWHRFEGIQGEKGEQGIPGVGIDGKTTYLHIKYSNDGGSTFTSNNGETVGEYIGTCTDFNVNDPTTVGSYTWAKIKGNDGINGADGKTYYTWIKYADNSSGGGLSDSPTGKTYIGFAYNKTTATESNTASDYTWSLIKGEKGDTGVKGDAGANGVTYYTWIKYSPNANGSEMTDDPVDNSIYKSVSFTVTTPSTGWNNIQYRLDNMTGILKLKDISIVLSGSTTNYSSVTSKDIEGENKSNQCISLGLTDYTALRGKSITISYSYCVISNTTNGSFKIQTQGSTVNGETANWAYLGSTINISKETKYIGIAPNQTTASESTDATKYTWSKFKGDTGVPGTNGTDGVGVESIVIEYAKNQSTSTAPTSGWSTSIPAYVKDYYLWYRTRTKYTNNSNYTYSTPVCDTSWSAIGDIMDVIGDWTNTSTISESFSNITKDMDSIKQEVKRNTRISQFRYIRDYCKGSTVNTGNHFVEIQVFKNGTNVALNKTVTCNGTGTNLSYVTNGDITASQHATVSGTISTEGDLKGYQYVQVDLGSITTNIEKIKIWHYYTDARAYYHKLEVSKDGNEWYRIFDSEKNGVYNENSKGKTYIIDDTYSESQFEQTADKFNWMIKSGTSSSNMVLTDDFYKVVTNNIKLTAKNITLEGLVTANSNFKILSDGSIEAVNGKFKGAINGGTIDINSGKFTVNSNGKVAINDGSISINNGVFKVLENGNTKIGGDTGNTVEGYNRALLEITSNGNLYSVSPDSSKVYTKISEGTLKVVNSSYTLTIDDAFASNKDAVLRSSLNSSTNGAGGSVWLCCNGGDIKTTDSRAIRYFKNPSGDYVFRPNSTAGVLYNGTGTYPWKEVCSKNFNNTSDRTLKENVSYLSNANSIDNNNIKLKDLYEFMGCELPIALYNYISDTDKKIGFMAQDVIYNTDGSDNKVGQLIVNPKSYKEEHGKLTYDVNNYISVIAGALQFSISEVENLKDKIKVLEEKLCMEN